jgi:hypothetical protein
MKTILILGALPADKKDRQLYQSIIDSCRGERAKISSPIDTAEFKGTDQERYERAFDKVRQADLIIGELSRPSTGQGMELRDAALQGKEIIIVASEGSKVSGLVKGCPAVNGIIYYKDINDLKQKLKQSLSNPQGE